MNADEHRWAVLLPAVLTGGDLLIRDAVRRARTVVARERVCIVVEREHHRYWWPLGSIVPAANLLVQPRNCGSAIGILFAVLKILERDPVAKVLFVPADHYFEDEAAVSFALSRAFDRTSRGELEVALIAVEAENPATDLAYVVPGARLQQDVYRVREFIARPDARLAQLLCKRGSLASTFLFCAWGFSILALFREYLPAVVDAMTSACAQGAGTSRPIDGLREVYARLPTVDFSHTVMPKARAMMQVIHARGCGWTDLGTQERMQHAMRRWSTRSARRAAAPSARQAAVESDIL
jgi:mannose-1-phosphate guanylyltransferase